ncbi:hypothetical protein NP233_g6840 [Leucocoprinus birnbaumii]|uniref:Uncharacterized protein n=1 Tax=Leucocoprinus birnbaumii TaxID=56174 RepID=A0AAD5VQH5_9AGAR|nr:hypothetical protein NP233_g6840 [Leucocoprinus birnbaumii]
MVCYRFLQRLPSLRVLHFRNVSFDSVAVDSELFEALSIALRVVTDLSIEGDAGGFPLHTLANCSTIETLELDLQCLAINAAGTSPSNWLLERYGAATSPTTPVEFSFIILRALQLEYREIAPFTREDLARCRPGGFIPPVSWDGFSSATELAGAILRNAGEVFDKLVMMVELLDKGNSFVSTEDMANICNLRTLAVVLSMRPSYFGTVSSHERWLETLVEILPSTRKLEDFRIQYTARLETDEDEEAVLRTVQSFESEINLFKKGRKSPAVN